MKIKILNNISTKEMFAVIMIIVTGIIMIVVPITTVLIYTNQSNKRDIAFKKEVYLWDNESLKKAKLAENFKSPEDGSLKAHLVLFHKLFWSSEPYMEYIEQNHELAYKMGDKSVQVLKRFLDQENYFETNVAGGYHILSKIDDTNIEVDYTVKPYKFKVSGNLKVIRNNDIQIKRLVATGSIRTKRQEEKTAMEKHDFESWFIQDYDVVDFSIIKNLKQSEL